MAQTQILIVGKHPEIMKIVLRLVGNQPDWHGGLAFSSTEAIEQSKTVSFDVVLLCAGLSEYETDAIKTHFNVPVIQHYGGGSGLLYAEIYQALEG